MKVVIAGSRGVGDYDLLCEVMTEAGFDVTEVVCGKEPTGVDALGERWALERDIPVAYFPAEWERYTPRGGQGSGRNPAGMIRNREMAKYSDAAVIMWNGTSPGSRNMIAEMARFRGKPTHVHIIGKPRIQF